MSVVWIIFYDQEDPMKYILFTIAVLLASCATQQTQTPVEYDSVDAAIINGVLKKDDKNYNSHVILINFNNRSSIDFAIKSAPVFMQAVKKYFLVADTSAARKLLTNNIPSIDTSVRDEASPHIRFIKDSSTVNPHPANGQPVIDVFFKLVTKEGDKCIVFVHWIDGGAETALLERRDGKWKVSSIQTEFFE